MTCPCGSNADFQACCGPRLDGSKPAETPEALMRSRYTAFARRDAAYLVKTHAAAPPADLAAFAKSLEAHHWLSLSVDLVEPGANADEGFVTFTAKSLEPDGIDVLHERSRFTREGGLWRYVDGKLKLTRERVSANDPCPCGSGLKFKKCHA